MYVSSINIHHSLKPNYMLRWSFAFLIIALIAALFGFTNIAQGAADIARVLFAICLGIWLIMLLAGLFFVKKG
jgi:uncharacterized membrane protein YtjA (UPF0391 family)